MKDAALGKVEVSPRAIASIAGEAILSCYGVVGMSATTLRDGIAEVLRVDNYHRGVQVDVVDDKIIIDISEVAHNVMENVKFSVEQALGMPVREVNVHVQGLRVSNDD